MKFHPEIAVLDDLEGICALEAACFDTDIVSKRQYRHLIRSPSALVAIVRDGKRVAAIAVYLFRKGSDKARIYSLAVHPEYRRHGLAATLCSYCEKLCRKRGCCEVRLEVKWDNASAIQFYLKNHYVEFGRYVAFYEDGKDAIRMKRSLISYECC